MQLRLIYTYQISLKTMFSIVSVSMLSLKSFLLDKN